MVWLIVINVRQNWPVVADLPWQTRFSALIWPQQFLVLVAIGGRARHFAKIAHWLRCGFPLHFGAFSVLQMNRLQTRHES